MGRAGRSRAEGRSRAGAMAAIHAVCAMLLLATPHVGAIIVQGKHHRRFRLLGASVEGIGFKPPRCRQPSADEFWVASLRAELVLSSPLPREVIVATVVQPYTLHRLEMLQAVCEVWRGAVSAAVYVPLLGGRVQAPETPLHGRGLDAARDEVQRMFDRLKGHCRLDLALVTEQLPSNWTIDDRDQFYTVPVNSLRNVAMGLARTELVLPIDADFVPGPSSLHASLAAQHEELLDTLSAAGGAPAAVVLPAFRGSQKWGQGVQHDGAPLTLGRVVHDLRHKRAMARALASGLVHYFDLMYHGWTRYDHWHKAEAMYKIDFPTSDDCAQQPTVYEPYVVVRRSLMPAWDERFRGYHFNKQSQMWLMAKLGFTWYVTPHGYVVHMPHEHQPGLKHQHGLSAKHQKISHIFNVEMRNTLSEGQTFHPVGRRHTFLPYNKRYAHQVCDHIEVPPVHRTSPERPELC